MDEKIVEFVTPTRLEKLPIQDRLPGQDTGSAPNPDTRQVPSETLPDNQDSGSKEE